jgi:hypothetical protein
MLQRMLELKRSPARLIDLPTRECSLGDEFFEARMCRAQLAYRKISTRFAWYTILKEIASSHLLFGMISHCRARFGFWIRYNWDQVLRHL